jgi:predicted nucleic acid-binding protein
MFLLDTNVVSELRRARPHRAVLAWLEAVPPAALFLSAVTLAEIQRGVELTRERDPARASEIEQWLDAVAATWSVLPLTGPICRRWAIHKLHRPNPREDSPLENYYLLFQKEERNALVPLKREA